MSRGLGDVYKRQIEEFKWGAKEPSVEIQLKNCTGYQAWPFSVEKALSQEVK